MQYNYKILLNKEEEGGYMVTLSIAILLHTIQ